MSPDRAARNPRDALYFVGAQKKHSRLNTIFFKPEVARIYLRLIFSLDKARAHHAIIPAVLLPDNLCIG